MPRFRLRSDVVASGRDDFPYTPNIEGDAYTPAAADAPPPASPNPFSVNLYENIQRLKLDVKQIAALHGPRLATIADLRTAIGASGASN